jgi:hypothetical protein
MQRDDTKSNLTSIMYRNDAQPWDDFVTNTDSSTMVNEDKNGIK